MFAISAYKFFKEQLLAKSLIRLGHGIPTFRHNGKTTNGFNFKYRLF